MQIHSLQMHFANIVNSYRWIWLSLASEILMRYVDFLRFSSCACLISMLQKKSMFGVVAHSFVECSGKKWISSTMVLFCFRISMRNQSHSFAMHSVQFSTNTYSQSQWTVQVFRYDQTERQTTFITSQCVPVSAFSMLCLLFAICQSIVNDGLQSGHTHTPKQKQFYI